MKKVFEYVVVFNPKDDKEVAKIIVQPTVELADTKEAVAMKAARAIPEEYVDRIDDIEIIVRNF